MSQQHDLFLRRNGKDREGHCRVSRLGLRQVIEAVADRRLRPADVVVLLTLMQGVNLGRGTIRASQEELAAATGFVRCVIQESLRRLQVEGLVLRAQKRRYGPSPCLAVSPDLTLTGHPTFAAEHLRFWAAAKAENPVPVLPPPPSAIRSRRADPPAAPADDDQAA